jgi:hypothetical protein
MNRSEEWLEQYQAKRRGEPSTSRRAATAGESEELAAFQEAPRTRREYHDYKADFLNQIQLAGLPMPSHGKGCEVKELLFARPRLWRFDWAYESQRIAIEYQGGNYTGKGRHNSVKGLKDEYEKFTEAAIQGWLLILIDSESVRDGRAVAWVERALKARAGEVGA